MAVILATFARTFLVQAVKIPSRSMEPGLLAGDHVLINKFIYGFKSDGSPPPVFLPMRRVSRGDVVVFTSSTDPSRDFIKRCVALPGETIALGPEGLMIDRSIIDESGYVVDDRKRSTYGPYTVLEGHYFCLGDHRSISQDSRSWGPVSERSLKGRAFMIYWSVAEPGSGDRETWDRMDGDHKRARGALFSRWRRCLRVVR